VYAGGSARHSAQVLGVPGNEIVTSCAAFTTPPYDIGSVCDAVDAPAQLFCDAGTKIATLPSEITCVPENVTTYGIMLRT
jgi:hypothetical protein